MIVTCDIQKYSGDIFKRFFFSFIQHFDFCIVIGVKGPQMAQHDKNFCPLRTEVGQVISPAVVLKILIFQVFRGGIKGQKMTQIPISACHTVYLKSCTLYHQDFWYTCKIMISPGVVFLYFF